MFYIDPAPINDDVGKIVIRKIYIDGSMTTINSTTIDISDLAVKLASNSNAPSESNGAGIKKTPVCITLQQIDGNLAWDMILVVC